MDANIKVLIVDDHKLISEAWSSLLKDAPDIQVVGTADNVDAFEWAMDPDNDPNTADDMPAFINNSWHDPSIDNACVNIYVDMLTAVEAAGIGVVFSAGKKLLS